MKIFFLSPTLDLSIRDAGRTHVLELVHELSAQHDVKLFAKSVPEPVRRYIRDFSQLPEKIHRISMLLNLAVESIKGNKPDVIYSRGYPFFSVMAGIFLGAPFIIEVNGLPLEEMKMHKRVGILKKYYILLLERVSLKQAKRVITVTKGLKDILVRRCHLPESKFDVIHNGANTRHFRPIARKAALKKVGLDSNFLYIVFVGNFATWQGLEYLIRAMPMIFGEIENCRLLVVGSGLLEKSLKRLAKELEVDNRIIFTGYADYKDVPFYINSAEICIAPFIKYRNSKIGLSPLKIYEYLACGKPVVASQIPGLEFIERNRIGVLVPPENKEALADSILNLLSMDRNELERMGAEGRRVVEEFYSWKRVGEKVERVCKEAVSHKISADSFDQP